eukprot:765662-Hanusia_phi.AAC.1
MVELRRILYAAAAAAAVARHEGQVRTRRGGEEERRRGGEGGGHLAYPTGPHPIVQHTEVKPNARGRQADGEEVDAPSRGGEGEEEEEEEREPGSA